VYGAAALSAVAALTDAKSGRIPNWLTMPAVVLGLGIRFWCEGAGAPWVAVLGLLSAALVPWALYACSGGAAIGGGDVKLFAALGALCGPTLALEIEFASFVLLSLMAGVRMAYRGKLLRVLVNAGLLLVNPLLPRARRFAVREECLTEMRMGPAIAFAALGIVAAEQTQRIAPWLL
jgi:prepilin peptidase CpaA